MRRPPLLEVEKRRLAGIAGEPYGQFLMKMGAFRLFCQASADGGWDHVSVSLSNRCPTWDEMDHVKRLFWEDSEVVMQLHIHGEAKVNTCHRCLHLWRPQTPEESQREKERCEKHGEPVNHWTFPGPIPLPPRGFV